MAKYERESVSFLFPINRSPRSIQALPLGRHTKRSPVDDRFALISISLCPFTVNLLPSTVHRKPSPNGVMVISISFTDVKREVATLGLFPSALLSYPITVTIPLPILHPLHLHVLLLSLPVPFFRLRTPFPLPSHPFRLAIRIET